MANKRLTFISMIILLSLSAVFIITSLMARKYKVPSLTGTDAAQCEQILRENNIPESKVIYSYIYSDSAEKDIIIRQIPEAGGTISDKAHLILTVSMGENPDSKIEIPDFSNMDRKQIEQWLTENGFTNYTFTEKIDDSAAEGTLLSCQPPAGSKVKQEDEVVIELAVHSPAAEFPDFTGKKVDDIQKWADTYDIQVNFVYYYDTSETDTFLFADFEPGTVLERGSSISIAVSTGPQ